MREDKVLLVMAGQLVLQLGEQEHHLASGDGATITGGTPHRFYNDRAEEACLLMLLVPGGHDVYLSELASLDARGALTGQALQALSARFGVAILGDSEGRTAP